MRTEGGDVRHTREKPRILKYGGRGVDVALRTHSDPGPETVFWSPPRYHEDGSPGGGFNSFVLVDDPNGYFLTEAGERVALVSINGIGEIRWKIDAPYMIRDAEGSIEHFGLKVVDRG